MVLEEYLQIKKVILNQLVLVSKLQPDYTYRLLFIFFEVGLIDRGVFI